MLALGRLDMEDYLLLAGCALAVGVAVLIGGYLLHFAAHRIAKVTTLTFKRCLAAFAVACLVCESLMIGAKLLCDFMDLHEAFHTVWGLVALLIGAVASVIIIAQICKTNTEKTLWIWFPWFGIGVVGVSLAIAIFTPVLNKRTCGQPPMIYSANNLRTIGIGLAIYACSNDDVYPPRLDLLVDGGEIAPKMLHYPRDPNRRYFYRRPTKDTPQTALVACEPRPSYKDKRWVLLMSGEVEQATEPEFQKLLAKPENKAFAEAWREAQVNANSTQVEASQP